MCGFDFLADGYCGNLDEVRIYPVAPMPTLRKHKISNRARAYAMAIRVWLHEGDKNRWDYHNCRKSYL